MKASIILPVYNAESTIADSIRSIIEQSFQDFELIIINDGSTDRSEDIINSFDDSRILYTQNTSNQGLIYTLNLGLRKSKGEYIARMDADDIALKDRLLKQVQYMDNNQSCIACGTQLEYFGTTQIHSNSPIYHSSDSECKAYLILNPCFAHPSVILRSKMLKDNNIYYNEKYKYVEDYKFWIDLSDYGTFHNLPEALLKYRISATQITSNNNELQNENAKLCRREYIKKHLSIEIPEKITYEYVKEIRKSYKNEKYLLEVLCFSLDKYTFKFFLYYIANISLGYNLNTNWRLLKRFVRKYNKLL